MVRGEYNGRTSPFRESAYEDADLEYSLHHRRSVSIFSKIKHNLEVFIEAAKMREETLDHVLLYGPPGLGKTTLANIIANEMGVNVRTTSGPAIERPGDLAAVLTALQPGMYYLLMKFIVCIDQLKKYCILRWKTFALIL